MPCLECGLTLRGEFLEERIDAGVEVDLARLDALHHGGEGGSTGAASMCRRGVEQWQD
jgi:hypothetical protein